MEAELCSKCGERVKPTEEGFCPNCRDPETWDEKPGSDKD